MRETKQIDNRKQTNVYTKCELIYLRAVARLFVGCSSYRKAMSESDKGKDTRHKKYFSLTKVVHFHVDVLRRCIG